MSIQRSVVRALHSTHLEHDPDQETAIDRVMALGHADPLGSLLWRLKWSDDLSVQPAVLHLLVRRTRSHESLSMIQRVCALALHEYLHDLCRPCGGRGIVIAANGVKSRCSACRGEGTETPSPSRRAQRLRVSETEYLRVYDSRVARARGCIERASKSVSAQVLDLLGKNKC